MPNQQNNNELPKAEKEDGPLINSFSHFGKVFAIMSITPSKDPNKHDSKVPLDPRTGAIMQWKKNPQYMNIFDAVTYKYDLRRKFPNHKFAIGLYLGKCDALMLDLDDIPQDIADKDKPDSKLDKLRQLTQNTYAEISQSGTGVHFIMRGKKIRKTIRNTEYEFYEDDRWATLTGNTIWGTSEVKALDADQMKDLENYIWGPEQPKRVSLPNPFADDYKEQLKEYAASGVNLGHIVNPFMDNTPQVTIQKKQSPTIVGNKFTPDQLIEKIKQSKSKDKFELLFNGGAIAGNQSQDDYSLALQLIWWTNHDLKKADAMFRKSKRMRDKWDTPHNQMGETYGQITLNKADKAVEGGYNPAKLNYPSMKACLDAMENFSKAWHAKNTTEKDGKTVPKQMSLREILTTLERMEKWAIPYSQEDPLTIESTPIHYYDWDQNLYKVSTQMIEKMIMAIEPTLIDYHKRRNIVKSLIADRGAEPKQITKIKYPNLVAVGNGVYDKNSNVLRPYNPDTDVFTQKSATPFHEVEEPVFADGWHPMQLFDDIAGNDPEKKKLVWEIVYAAITGNCQLNQIMFLVDDDIGSTGKSTYQELIGNVVGKDNYAVINLDEYGKPNAMVRAVGKQLIIGDEYNVDRHYRIQNSAPFKRLATNGPMNVKRLYEDENAVTLNCLVIQSANGMPRFVDQGAAIYDRIAALVFTKKHSRRVKANAMVKNVYIKDEKVLEWVLYYALTHVKMGISFTQPQESIDFINQERLDRDSFNNFKESVLGELQSTRVPTRFLYNLYFNSSLADGFSKDDILSTQQFNKHMDSDTKWRRLVKNADLTTVNKNGEKVVCFNKDDQQLFNQYYESAGPQKKSFSFPDIPGVNPYEKYRGGIFFTGLNEVPKQDNK